MVVNEEDLEADQEEETGSGEGKKTKKMWVSDQFFNKDLNCVFFFSRISSECSDCLSSVAMAVWNCGTFEMDCIKGAIELGSECYPCVCEVLDTLWPDDAPNCFKKRDPKDHQARSRKHSSSH